MAVSSPHASTRLLAPGCPPRAPVCSSPQYACLHSLQPRTSLDCHLHHLSDFDVHHLPNDVALVLPLAFVALPRTDRRVIPTVVISLTSITPWIHNVRPSLHIYLVRIDLESHSTARFFCEWALNTSVSIFQFRDYCIRLHAISTALKF